MTLAQEGTRKGPVFASGAKLTQVKSAQVIVSTGDRRLYTVKMTLSKMNTIKFNAGKVNAGKISTGNRIVGKALPSENDSK